MSQPTRRWNEFSDVALDVRTAVMSWFGLDLQVTETLLSLVVMSARKQMAQVQIRMLPLSCAGSDFLNQLDPEWTPHLPGTSLLQQRML